MNGIGWQEDGTYVPCPRCGCEPPPPPRRPLPGVAVGFRSPGMELHHGDCPSVPQISRECRERLIEMDRVRRRGAAQAANYVIG